MATIKELWGQTKIPRAGTHLIIFRWHSSLLKTLAITFAYFSKNSILEGRFSNNLSADRAKWSWQMFFGSGGVLSDLSTKPC